MIFGVDCHMDHSGALTVYEANCNMNVLVNTRVNKAAAQPYVERIRHRLITAISDRIAQDGPLQRGLQPARS